MQFLLIILIVVSIGAYKTAANEWGPFAGFLSILVAISFPILSIYLWGKWLEESDKNDSKSREKEDDVGSSSSQANKYERHQYAFLKLLAAMIAKMAKIDGRIDASEIQAAEDSFARLGLSEVQCQLCILAFRNALNEQYSIDYYAEEMVNLGFGDEMRWLAYEVLWDIACADGRLAAEEKNALERLEQVLKLKYGVFARLFRERVRQTNKQDNHQRGYSNQYKDLLDEEYEELGCTRMSTDEEIRNAYRNLAKRLHPDILKAQGMPDALMGKANVRMARINAAWDKIKKIRGIKN